VDAGVYEQMAVSAIRKRLPTQPVDQLITVVSLQDGCQCVATPRLAHAGCSGQQMKIMVSQHTSGAIAQRHYGAQTGQ